MAYIYKYITNRKRPVSTVERKWKITRDQYSPGPLSTMNYLFLNSGLRFSMKAFIPSRRSSVAKVWVTASTS